MGWQIWCDTGNEYASQGHLGFYCDTEDKSFGPVFLTDTDFDKALFHKLWELGNFEDPRYAEPQVVYNQTKHLISLINWNENIISTLKITRFGEGHAPVTICEISKKDSYENMEFSFFGEEFEYGDIKLKSITDDEYQYLEEMLDDLNSEVNFMIVSQGFIQNPITIAHTQNNHLGLGMTIEWEVLDKD